MKKTIFIYGIALALLVFLLENFEYRYIVREYPTEIFVLFLAILFTGIGLWAGRMLTTSKVYSNEFRRNENAIEYLQISDRELEVLELVAKGYSNKEIANNLFVSVNTVKTHLQKVYEKLEVNRRTQAVEKAKGLKIIR